MQEHAAWKLSSMAPMQGVPPALPPGTLAPRAGAAAAPAHPALVPRSVREIVRSVQPQRKGLLCEIGKRDNKEMDWGISIAHRTPSFLGSHYFSCIKCTFSLPKMMFPCKELEKGIGRA